jgi:hypothetical protein
MKFCACVFRSSSLHKRDTLRITRSKSVERIFTLDVIGNAEDLCIKRKTWYTNGGYESVMFVDSTPKGELARKCRDLIKEGDFRIRVVEKSGTSIKDKLTKSNPFPKKSCIEGTCNVCSTTNKVNCKIRDTVYKISCKVCGECYIGETARSIEERFKEHIVKYNNRDNTSVFSQHINEKHGGQHQLLELEILAWCSGDPMLRQVTEATYIHELKPSLNAKEEWGNSNVSKRRWMDIA